MAPIKFEEQLKEKLEKRNLTPTPEAWTKLADRLDTDKSKSKNPIYWWLSIAAGLIIMLTVSIAMFKTNDGGELEQQLVEETVSEGFIEPKAVSSQDSKSVELVSEDKQLEDEIKYPEKEKSQILTNSKVMYDTSSEKALVAEGNSHKTKHSSPNPNTNLNAALSMATDPALTTNVITDVSRRTDSQQSLVMDLEIDALLKIATQELLNDRLIKDSKKTVDANALLESVQEDMGTSFRSRVFEALKDSFQTVKTAVAQRNN